MANASGFFCRMVMAELKTKAMQEIYIAQDEDGCYRN